MKNRLISNYATTIIGVVILGVAVYQWVAGTPVTEVSLIAGYGLLFLRSKDSLIGLPAKNEDQNDER